MVFGLIFDGIFGALGGSYSYVLEDGTVKEIRRKKEERSFKLKDLTKVTLKFQNRGSIFDDVVFDTADAGFQFGMKDSGVLSVIEAALESIDYSMEQLALDRKKKKEQTLVFELNPTQ